MLVDPELAERARELLREPHEANGKGNMSALGTHEFTGAAVNLGLEPPLSPPVVRGPSAMMPDQSSDALPSPPPALRPPESSVDESEPTPEIPEFPPAPQPLEMPATPQQPDPLEEQTLMAPPPLAPVQPNEKAVEPKAPAPVPELPSMAPAPEPVQPAAAPPEPVAAPPEPVPAPELAPPPAPEPAPAPAEVTELQPATLTPPPAATPVEVPAAEQPEAPAVELPVIDLTPPAAPEALPEEPPVIDLTPEPAAPAPAPVVEPAFVTPGRGVFKGVVRLTEGDGVEVGEFPDFGTAMEGAQEVIEQFANANGSWPFYAGRFIRPDLIISVDVVEA